MGARFTRPHTIVLIGGGFAGTVTAIKLLDGATDPLSIILIEKRAELGRGVAYSTTEPVHLVNGAARIFGLHPEDPDHLVRWLFENAETHGWLPPEDIHDSSPPRWLYGTYVQSELRRAVAEAPGDVTFQHVEGTAIAVARRPSGLEVVTDTAGTLGADAVVLALGVFQSPPTASEFAVLDHPRYVGNPWDPSALDRLTDARDLLIVGASLSMVDVVASMESRGFAGRYQVLSRRGQVVERRRNTEVWRDFLGAGPLPRTARQLLAAVKAERRAIAAADLDWQGLPLSIRPHLLKIWQGADTIERLRFARHLRAFWDVTAHRAAPPAYAAVTAAAEAGRFDHGAGRVLSLDPDGDRIIATIRRRGSDEVERREFDGVINCRGHQQHDWRAITDPLVENLLGSGLVRPHATGFGIDATGDGTIIGADGRTNAALSAIGHPLRGVAWESSSIGEQLAQAIALADRLLLEAQLAPAAQASLI